MKKIVFKLIILSVLFPSICLAAKSYPNFSGEILSEHRTDKIFENNTLNRSIEKNSSYFNFELKSALQFNENWSFKQSINLYPAPERQYVYPERSRFILGQDRANERGVHVDKSALVAEELKVSFQNEDLDINIGKFNPTFATLYRRNKRIGFFVTDFTEDYELREKIGFSIAALLDDSKITLSTFFNDTTDLSGSGLNQRNKLRSDNGIAGSNNKFSSYSVTMEGRDFMGLTNLFYNFGYRNLGVKESDPSATTETGYTMNLEYLHKLSETTFLIPIFEAVKIENFTGRNGRDATYLTTSLIFKYSGWNSGITYLKRDIDNNYLSAPITDNSDSLLQVNIGYKFKNNLSIDLSRAEIKEDNSEVSSFGLILSYLYEF